ncbi:MAG: InlB B-repeat-containing protein [Paludibacteraceae bacterium]|nr:InlB B-repeat-containing protein [Paludibacteraceae bacterium]
MRKSNTFFQVGYMYMQGTLRGAACALLMMIWLGLGSASGADFSAAEIVASGGTQKSHVTCSSSQTSTSSGKIKNLSGQTCVSISSTADTNPGVNYIQIQADEGYTIDNSLVITGAAGGSSDKNAVVLMWRGAYSATTADTCFSVLTPENDSGTRDTIALRFPSGRFRTIRIYRRINYNEGTIGSSATGSSYQIPSSNASSFVVKDISATATAAVTTKMVYLNPNDYGDWAKGDERYAVYGWNATGNAWYDMTPMEDGCGGTIYKAEVSLDYTGLIFCRMNGATTENNWSNKWDQTYDVTAANGCYCKITGVSGDPQKATYTYENKPFKVCVSGSWLRFTGETITLTASCAGAKYFQWYKGGVEESNKIDGATSATFTKTNCTHADAGEYYCKAWSVTGDENATWSGAFKVRVPILIIQTPPATPGDISGDRQEVALTRASESDEVVTCGIYLGVAWTYEFVIDDGFKTYGNTGTMNSSNCTNWTMDNNSAWCRLESTKEGTYHFEVAFTNSALEPIIETTIFPPMVQTAGLKLYMENTLDMQARGWDNNSIYYRIGKGKYDKGDTRNWTAVQQMALVPGTARYLYTTTPDWANDFWVWHIANNKGDANCTSSIYRTYSDDGFPITESSNFNGDEITQDWTIYLNSTSGGYGMDGMNNNCQFYSYTHSNGMIVHDATIAATTNGQIKVEYTHHDNTAQTNVDYAARTINDLAHTCNLTISALPDNGYRCTSLQVNGVDFTSGSTHILDANATITATFDHATYPVTLHTNEGTINAGNVTEYTHGTGATLPTDVTKTNKEFAGWYDNAGCTGDPIASISTTEWGNKEYWAKWIDEVPKVTYILGSCYVNNGMWTQGSDGNVKAWLYQPGATVAQNTLIGTTNISYSSTSTGGVYFNTKDITLLDNESYWNTSSGSNRAIKALKVGSGSTLTFNLSGMIATKISFYVFPNTNDAYSIDLTVNGATTNHAIAKNSQHKWHKFAYKGGNYSGEFSITSNGKESRVVVIVEVPLVTVTFDKNHASATGTMENMSVPKGSTFALSDNAFALADYNFLGWTEDAGGAGVLISDGADYTTEEDVTLYAKWEQIIKTTITLDATGAYNSYTGSVVATYNKPMPEITVLPKRAGGYVFDGYYTEPNGAGTQYYNGLGYSVKNWDKTDATYTLYAKWLEPCDLVPTLTNVSPGVTIWDEQHVDVSVVKLTCNYEVAGIEYSLQSVSPTNPINGCTFDYFDEYIHMIGTPSVGNTTVQNIPVTFTMKNSCDPARTYQITTSIRIYPAGQRPKIAFIVTGTKNGAFTAYSAEDAASCNALVTYLSNYYDVTYVNGYASKDEAQLEAYYDQYDLMVVTDFLNTGEGYTNALGTMIDKKPILSFEAYVANLPNWHIGSNPKDPSPKVQDMKVLCAGHAIFKNAKYNPGDASETMVVNPTDTTVHVLSSLSTADKAKGLQGFTINEAPDFIFLATIRDENNDRDLIVCCERQVTFPARLLLYGINFNEMPNLSPAGQIVMKQMIDYLLMTDETKVADCSLVFDNKDGDHRWDNPKNWAPGYNIIPTPYHPTRIIAECHVNVDDAHAGSVKVNKGRDEYNQPVDGKLIVKPYGGLTVAGMVATVKDTRYASPITIKADELKIQADETNNGAFVYGNKESDVRATVEYYSRGQDANTNSPVWQYVGIPFQAGHTAIEMYYAAWMCRWNVASGMGGLWQWVENEDVLVPFDGYCITQAAPKTYTFAGKLNAPITTTLILDHRDAEGYAFAANSWTAPIKIQEMQDEDFKNTERTIYIYHTGSYANWGTNGSPVNAASGSAATLPGQYAAIPIHSSPYLAGADSVIPAMQGFFVKTTPGEDATLKLVYNRVVYDSKYFKTSTQPMRAPGRYGAPEVMQLIVSGESSGADRVHLLARSDFSDEFEDGWDGRKLDGDAAAPKLAVVKEAGEMSVAALPTADERYLSFRAGNDSVYTFSFDYDGETIYLYDRVTEEATEIRTGNTYTFRATNHTASNRFLITTTPPLKTPTDIAVVETGDGLHIENYGVETVEVRIVDMQGRVLYRLESSESILDIVPSLPAGVYLAHIVAGEHKAVVKLIGGQVQ